MQVKSLPTLIHHTTILSYCLCFTLRGKVIRDKSEDSKSKYGFPP